MRAVALVILSLVFEVAAAQSVEVSGYPYPVNKFTFNSQRQGVFMAYMDVKPERNSEGAVVLLHGKNFNGAYWHQTIEFLRDNGYRVLVPDQIGFGRSSMPQRYQFTFDQLAANTKALLDHLNLDEVTLMGHSMGGMLATRFALQYPKLTEHLLLLNPIGLEDWRAMGVPYVHIDSLYQSELDKSFESIKAYQRANYYDGEWSEEYQTWARMLARHYESTGGKRFAWNMALTSDMVLSQPVVYEFDQLQMPTTLLIGTRDRTAIGRGLVDEKTADRMGDYTHLGKEAAQRILDATLIEFEGVGHLPHIEAPGRYLEALAEQLELDGA